jgi:hypothetical protein
LGLALLADRLRHLCRLLELVLALQVRLSYRLRFQVSQPLLEPLQAPRRLLLNLPLCISFN